MYLTHRIAAASLAVLALATSTWAQSDVPRIGSEFIPPDAVVTAVLSVGNTMASPAAEMYPTEIADAWFKENIGILASDIDKIKLVVGAPGPGEPMAGVVVTLNKSLNVSALNQEIIKTQEPMDMDGVQVFPIMGPPGMVMHVKDAKTVLLGTGSYLGSMLRAADADASGPLASMAASVPHSATMTTVVAIEPLRPMINGLMQMQADQIPPPLMEFTKIPNLVDALLLRVDLEDPSDALRLVMLAGDESKADELMGILENGMQMGQQIFLAQMNEQIPADDPVGQATRQYMQRLSDQYVEMMTPEKEGRRLTIRSEATQGIASQGVLIGLLLPAVQSARQASRRMTSSNNMKQIALAIHNYHAAYRKLPSDIVSEDGTPLLSWRVALLSFMEDAGLYGQFKLDEPWDSPNNLPLMAQMPDVYSHPGMVTAPGTTVYQRPTGEGFMSAAEELKFQQLTDGLSNTIMGVETLAQDAVEWTKPADVQLDGGDPVGALDDGTRQGFNVMLADGAVLFFSNTIDQDLFKAMLTRAGGEAINPAGFR
ncbi:MAG: DUF1559 domain-containing protein [Planctomycetota bacterium]